MLRAVTVGASGVGKTSFLLRIKYDNFSTPSCPTVGVDFFGCHYKSKDRTVFVQYWDTAGHERFAEMLKTYIRRASLIFMMFDSQDCNSIAHLHRIKANVEDLAPTAMRILVATKCDLASPTPQEMRDMASALSCSAHFCVSAKTGANVSECVAHSVTAILDQAGVKKDPEKVSLSLYEQPTNGERTRSKSCC